eukprot:4430151-Ditylum_brightwellii.AAC.1
MPKKTTKKTSGRGIVLPISESGWERAHAMNIVVYGKKNQTVGLLWCCFTNLHSTKALFVDPLISQEVKEAKMEWLQNQAKLGCFTVLSDNSIFVEEDEVDSDDNTEEDSQDLLAPNMAQMITTISATRKKSIIELMPYKKAKKVKANKKVQKKKVKKPVVKKPVIEKTEHHSVASFVSTPKKKKLMAYARKMLDGGTISYPCQ